MSEGIMSVYHYSQQLSGQDSTCAIPISTNLVYMNMATEGRLLLDRMYAFFKCAQRVEIKKL